MSTAEKLDLINNIVSWLSSLENKVYKMPDQERMIIGYKFAFGGAPIVLALDKLQQFNIVSKFVLNEATQAKLDELVKNIDQYDLKVKKPLYDMIDRRNRNKINFVFNVLKSDYEIKSIQITYVTFNLITDATMFPIFELLKEMSDDYHRIERIMLVAS